MPIKCPHCNAELSGEEIKELIDLAISEGLAKGFAGRHKGTKNSSPRVDIGSKRGSPAGRKPESESELKKVTSAENGKKGGRPKGSLNKAPRADIGIKRGQERAFESGTMYTVDSVRMSESSFRKKLSEMDGGKKPKWETIRKESQVHKVLRLTDEDGNTHTFRISKISV